VGEITIKGTKGLVDNKFFMHPDYFENVSHITFKWYKYTIFCITFIYSWSYRRMDLKSFHCVIKVLLHMQRTCWQVLKTTIKYEHVFFLFKPSPNAFKFCMKMGHVSNHSKIFLHAYMEIFLHDWLKWFQMCLMTKIVHNLS